MNDTQPKLEEGFYYLHPPSEPEPTLTHGYYCSDLGGRFVFGFNTHDGGGLVELSDLTSGTTVTSVAILPIIPPDPNERNCLNCTAEGSDHQKKHDPYCKQFYGCVTCTGDPTKPYLYTEHQQNAEQVKELSK